MNPLYQQASFLLSAPRLAVAPADKGFEVAFAGRSNAGKSSAINAITSRKSLARTSKTPGRTQQLIFFELDSDRRLVDLPGYGFSKVSAERKKTLRTAVEEYLAHRNSLRGIFLLADIRRALTDFDHQLIEYCDVCEIPLHLALTKADKLKRGAAKNSLLKTQKKLETLKVPWSIQLFSSLKRVGIEDAQKVLDNWLAV